MNKQQKPGKRIPLFAAIAAIILLAYFTIYLPEETFLSLSQEDGVFEYLTALLFLGASVGFFLLFANPRYFQRKEDQALYSTYGRRYVFLILGLMFFFGFGEEISWGQRILGFATPEKLEAKNVQEEFNIHNLEVFNIKSKEGVRKEGLQALFTMKQMFLATFLGYLLLVPLFSRYVKPVDKLLKTFYIPVPPLWLGVFFAGNYAAYRIIRGINPWELQWGLTEVQEFNFALILLLFPLTWMGLSKYAR
jgi:hypothetical protein